MKVVMERKFYCREMRITSQGHSITLYWRSYSGNRVKGSTKIERGYEYGRL